MAGSMRHAVAMAVNRTIKPLGLKLSRADGHDWTNQEHFIPYEATIKAAREAGLSVGAYIDTVMNLTPGATDQTIEGMRRLGVFSQPITTVVEIGPGSGRYLERTIAACSPARYEVYETAAPWAAHLAREYKVLAHPTDGKSLDATPAESADLVQAHKVFSSITFMATCRYWPEIVRVTRPGGFAVFDLLTESCLDPETFDRWAASGINAGTYPATVPAAAATGYFTSRGFALVGSFFVPMGPGRTETFVFRKADAAK